MHLHISLLTYTHIVLNCLARLHCIVMLGFPGDQRRAKFRLTELLLFSPARAARSSLLIGLLIARRGAFRPSSSEFQASLNSRRNSVAHVSSPIIQRDRGSSGPPNAPCPAPHGARERRIPWSRLFGSEPDMCHPRDRHPLSCPRKLTECWDLQNNLGCPFVMPAALARPTMAWRRCPKVAHDSLLRACSLLPRKNLASSEAFQKFRGNSSQVCPRSRDSARIRPHLLKPSHLGAELDQIGQTWRTSGHTCPQWSRRAGLAETTKGGGGRGDRMYDDPKLLPPCGPRKRHSGITLEILEHHSSEYSWLSCTRMPPAFHRVLVGPSPFICFSVMAEVGQCPPNPSPRVTRADQCRLPMLFLRYLRKTAHFTSRFSGAQHPWSS